MGVVYCSLYRTTLKMAEKPEDLNLPASAINRIVKEALPDGVNVSKETKTAIARATSIFILYATTCANNFAIKSKRKTITASDIFQALQDMELEEFIPELKECLEVHKQDQKEKKEAAADRKKKQVAAAAAATASTTVDISEDPLNPTDTALSTTSYGKETDAADEQMEVEIGIAEGDDIQQAS